MRIRRNLEEWVTSPTKSLPQFVQDASGLDQRRGSKLLQLALANPRNCATVAQIHSWTMKTIEILDRSTLGP